MPTIKPLGKKIQITLEKPKAGALDLSGLELGTEVGTIIALGDEVNEHSVDGLVYPKFKIGDKIMYKAWMMDEIIYQGEHYYFLDSDGAGICAIIEE